MISRFQPRSGGGILPWSALWLVACLMACGPQNQSVSSSADEEDSADAGVDVESSSLPLWFWEEDCSIKKFNGVQYYICSGLNTWTNAKTRCENVGMKLVKIESEAENNFIQANVKFANWTGGSVPQAGANQTWSWTFDGSAICKSGWLGCTAINGAYMRWFAGEPLAGMTCMYQEAFTKEWHAGACGVPLGFVCENPDACANDPKKTKPGVCGCGMADTDRDLDGVADCIDQCPDDKTKTTSEGQCGCGVAETDTDLDGVPNCEDECPSTKGVYVDGMCGCASTAAPTTQACNDGVVPSSTNKCNGKGLCGDPTKGAPTAGACTYRERNGSVYWFCTGSKTWAQADALCRAFPGRKLVTINDSRENTFIKANNTLAAWTSANDQTADGVWRWASNAGRDGLQFWSGATAPQGKPYFSRFQNWAASQPVAGAAACGRVTTAGTWEAQACTQTAGFICENPSRTTRRNGPGEPSSQDRDNGGGGDGSGLGNDGTIKDPGEGYFPYPLTLTGPQLGCIDPTLAFSTFYTNGVPDDAKFKTQAAACKTCQENCQTEACGRACTACAGALAAPPVGAAKCTSTIDKAALVSMCRIQTVTLAGAEPKVCTMNSQCTAAGTVCGIYQPTRSYKCTERKRDWVNGSSNCQPADVLGGSPTYKSQKPIHACGVPYPGCPDGVIDNVQCAPEVPLCGYQLTPKFTLDPANPFEGNLAQIMPIKPFAPSRPLDEEDKGYYRKVKADACLNPNGALDVNGVCPASEKHPWCNYNVSSKQKLPSQSQDNAKHGKSGKGKLVEFDLDPGLILEFATMRSTKAGVRGASADENGDSRLPGPLGYLDFGLNARAQAVAKASFNFGPASGSINLIDLVAQVKADKCGMTTGDTHAKLFGIDFLPLIELNNVPFDAPEQATQDACNKAFNDFAKGVNRVKKAYRDAQELVSQYQKLVAQSTSTNTVNFGNICTALAANPPRGFETITPQACASEAPEDTINRFINYYNNVEIPALQKIVTDGSKLAKPRWNDDLFTHTSVEEQTLFTTTFLIGPVPVNMEVLSLLSYGINVSVDISINPFSVLANTVTTESRAPTSADLGKVTMTGTPWVGASVGLFIGVGFDIGVASAKAGVEGVLSLGKVALPVYASAGLRVGSEFDDRPPPEDLVSMVTPDSFAIVPRRYNVGLSYNYGASVHIRNLLNGVINAKVKIKFFWFSKTWRATLLEFKGICSEEEEGKLNAASPDMGPTKNKFCSFTLFSGDGTAKSESQEVDWGIISMPLPFHELDTISTRRPPGSVAFNPSTARELFYDNLCQCTKTPQPYMPVAADMSCYRDDDCCDAGTPDFLGCWQGPGTSFKQCSKKRVLAQSCNVLADCVPFKWTSSTGGTGATNCGFYTGPPYAPVGVTTPTRVCYQAL